MYSHITTAKPVKLPVIIPMFIICSLNILYKNSDKLILSVASGDVFTVKAGFYLHYTDSIELTVLLLYLKIVIVFLMSYLCERE